MGLNSHNMLSLIKRICHTKGIFKLPISAPNLPPSHTTVVAVKTHKRQFLDYQFELLISHPRTPLLLLSRPTTADTSCCQDPRQTTPLAHHRCCCCQDPQQTTPPAIIANLQLCKTQHWRGSNPTVRRLLCRRRRGKIQST